MTRRTSISNCCEHAILLLEVSAIDPGELRRYAEIYGGGPEIFLRDDGKGALLLCNEPVAAGNSDTKSVKKLFDGGRFGKSGGDWLFCAALWVPDDYRDEFVAWYQREHLPVLLECPAWESLRRGEGVERLPVLRSAPVVGQESLGFARAQTLAINTMVQTLGQECLVRWRVPAHALPSICTERRGRAARGKIKLRRLGYCRQILCMLASLNIWVY
jgi:hypothetical protein